MDRRLLRKCTTWLLPLLLLRAFLPVGFMLSAQAGKLELVFCPAQTPPWIRVAALDHAVHGGEHSAAHASISDHEDGRHSGGHLDTSCPFAVAAVGVTADLPPPAARAPRSADEPVAHQDVPFVTAGPARADRIRAPPLLS